MVAEAGGALPLALPAAEADRRGKAGTAFPVSPSCTWVQVSEESRLLKDLRWLAALGPAFPNSTSWCGWNKH